jgi:RNA polymerase sigma-70 factor (ECF subfamily)
MSTALQSLTSTPGAEPVPDEEVARRVLDGEVDLFEIIMRRHNRRLFRVTRSILDSDTDAEDVVQEAYVRAYAHLDTFEGRSKFATWLTRIAVYEALARKRRDARLDAIDRDDAETNEASILPDRTTRDPEQQVMDNQLRAALEHAIDGLPLRYRTVFVLREVQGMDTSETAECLGIQQQSVKTRLHRARRILRDLLGIYAGPGAEKAFNFLGSRCDRIVAAVLARIAAGAPASSHNRGDA